MTKYDALVSSLGEEDLDWGGLVIELAPEAKGEYEGVQCVVCFEEIRRNEYMYLSCHKVSMPLHFTCFNTLRGKAAANVEEVPVFKWRSVAGFSVAPPASLFRKNYVMIVTFMTSPKPLPVECMICRKRVKDEDIHVRNDYFKAKLQQPPPSFEPSALVRYSGNAAFAGEEEVMTGKLIPPAADGSLDEDLYGDQDVQYHLFYTNPANAQEYSDLYVFMESLSSLVPQSDS